MSSFVHLHVHSEFTLLKASSRVKDLIARCKDFGMNSLAITDIGNMFCGVDFYSHAKKAGIKPILASELIVTNGSRHTKKIPDMQENFSVLCYAKDETGYQNLLKLVSMGWTEGFHFLPRVDEELLAQYHEGLIFVLAQKKGIVLDFLKKGKTEEALDYINAKKELVGAENLYLEIVNHGLDEDREHNQWFRELSDETGVGLLASNDTYYTDKDDAKAHEILMAVAEKMTLSDERRPRFVNREFYFKSPEEMSELFEGYEDALENTVKLAQQCNVELKFGEFHLPKFPIPEGFDEDSFLRQRCEEELPNRYGKITPEVRERLDFELKVIQDMGFSAYFLIVSDFCIAAMEQGIPVGPGRGSAAGSIVAYLLQITNLDPIKYGLYFERFLNPSRISMPDIDIDFCFRRREEVIEYVKEKYGSEKVAQIITYGKLKSKAVLKDVARVLEIPFDEANEISKAVPPDAKNLVMGLEESVELQRWRDQYEQLFEVAIKLEGLARHTGIHAAGVIIAPSHVSDFVPLAGYGRNVTTQYDGSVLESQGLLKMDFLGLSTLTVIQDCLAHIKKNRKIELDLDAIPLDDPGCFEMLSRAQTAGLFQVDSDLFKRILKDMQPSRFEDIIALVALGRPGPLQMGMDTVYCNCSRNPDEVSYPHPLLEDLLKETYGVLLYQEQVMNTAVILAGYSMAEADDLRKVMGKKITEKMPIHRDKFVQGAANIHKVEEKAANDIFNLMATFAQYGFNKSHSAAYGLICYQTTFLKTHYPQEFMAAAMTDKLDSQEAITYLISDCQALEIPVLPPDVNKSSFHFDVDGENILFGLGAIKEVGEKAILNILKVREEKPFETFREFCYRVDLFTVNKKVVENLIKVGAFDCLPGNRAQKLKVMDSYIKEGQEYHKSRKVGQKFLFESKGKVQTYEDRFDDSLEDTRIRVEELAWEKELTGIYFSGHPLDEYRTLLERVSQFKTNQLESLQENTHVVMGGIVADFRRRVNRKGEDWISFKLCDYYGVVDCVAFPRQFKKVTFKVLNDQVVFVSGMKRIQDFNKKPQLILEDMELVDYLHESVRWNLELGLKLQEEDVKGQKLSLLKSLVDSHKGKKSLGIFYSTQGYQVQMSLPSGMTVAGDLSTIHALDETFGEEQVSLQLEAPPMPNFRSRR